MINIWYVSYRELNGVLEWSGFGRVGYGIIEYKNNKYKVIEYGSITTKQILSSLKDLIK